jgi:hypothetical protein
MHMIRDPTDTIRLAITLPHRTGKEGMDLFANAWRKPRMAVLGAPDQMDENVRK